GENQTTGKTPQGEYADTLFGSNTETTPGTQSTAWSPSAAGAQGTAGGNIANYGSTLPQSSGSYNSNALTGPGAVVLLTGSGDSYYNQVSAQAGSGKAYAGFFGPGMEDTFSQGTGAGGATLDLFRLTATTRVNTPGNTAVIPPAGQVYVGSFNFTSAGVLDFSTSASSFAPIPEPSTYAFVGVGSLLLMAWYRRRIQRTMA
ncbi:MAG TPA: PEP-CTERM sorting domain-containing protein, partial [Verrucomicrobiae bacterium]|nr:PEP-CTERM sorting domain-containing protein [Verrucomicrobiae bacterium]